VNCSVATKHNHATFLELAVRVEASWTFVDIRTDEYALIHYVRAHISALVVPTALPHQVSWIGATFVVAQVTAFQVDLGGNNFISKALCISHGPEVDQIKPLEQAVPSSVELELRIA